MFRIPHVVAGICVILLFVALRLPSEKSGQPSASLDQLAAGLKEVSLSFADWQGEDLPANEVILRAADCAGMIQRSYTNMRDDRQILLLLLVGKPGPISVHLPEVCYRGAGYRIQGHVSRAELPIDSRTAEFRTL